MLQKKRNNKKNIIIHLVFTNNKNNQMKAFKNSKTLKNQAKTIKNIIKELLL